MPSQRRNMQPAGDAPPPRRSARIKLRNEAATRGAGGASQALRIAMPSHAINGPRGRQRNSRNRASAIARNQLNRQETNLALENLMETNDDQPATPRRATVHESSILRDLLETYGIPPGTPPDADETTIVDNLFDAYGVPVSTTPEAEGASLIRELMQRYGIPPATPPPAEENQMETNDIPTAIPPPSVEIVAVDVVPIVPIMMEVEPISQPVEQSEETPTTSAGEMSSSSSSSSSSVALPPQNDTQGTAGTSARPQTSRQQSDRGATERIKRELQNFLREQPDGCTVNVEKDIFNWKATITGPEGTPYQGGIFHLHLVFDEQYPYTPPKVSFLTKIYHCNIIASTICLDILTSEWSPALTITKVLLSIISLLADPNPDDPLVVPIADLCKKNREAYDETARLWTSQYAVPDPDAHLYE